MFLSTAGRLALLLSLLPVAAHARPAAKTFALDEGVVVQPIADGVWRHTTTAPDGDAVNGLVVLGANGAILVDTGATPAQAEALVRLVQRRLHTPIVAVVLSDDVAVRTGGLAGMPPAVTVYASPATVSALGARLDGRRVMQLDGERVRELGGVRFEPVDLGVGADDDDVAVWFPDHGVLFGGDTVLAAGASPAVVAGRADRWRGALSQLDRRFGAATVVVPGVGDPGDGGLIRHTVDVLGGGGAAPDGGVPAPSASVR